MLKKYGLCLLAVGAMSFAQPADADYQVQAGSQAMPFNTFPVTDDFSDFNGVTAVTVGTGVVTSPAGDTASASGSASIASGVVSSSVAANNGVGRAWEPAAGTPQGVDITPLLGR